MVAGTDLDRALRLHGQGNDLAGEVAEIAAGGLNRDGLDAGAAGQDRDQPHMVEQALQRLRRRLAMLRQFLQRRRFPVQTIADRAQLVGEPGERRAGLCDLAAGKFARQRGEALLQGLEQAETFAELPAGHGEGEIDLAGTAFQRMDQPREHRIVRTHNNPTQSQIKLERFAHFHPPRPRPTAATP